MPAIATQRDPRTTAADGAPTPMDAPAQDLPAAGLGATIAHVSGPPPRTADRYYFACGDRPLDGYTIKRAIGRGGFGEVYYATSDAGKEVALKLVTRNLEVERRGVEQCMNLKSPHLIAIHDLRETKQGDTFVVMEYVSGQSLAAILAAHPDGLPKAEIRTWLKGLVAGVAYLHDHGIVHRDLKPANLFMEEGVVKIGDYGLAKAVANSRGESGHSECVGTCHYMAPETSTGKYHRPIDIYAIGIILYEMVTGRVPFDGESVGEVLMKHLTSRPDLTPLPEPFKALIGRALAKDPNHRPARVQDLLLPGDAAPEPAVRFIGDAKGVPVEPPKDDVLRITDEEPVMYIGVDTRPPARPPIPFVLATRRVFGPLRWVVMQKPMPPSVLKPALRSIRQAIARPVVAPVAKKVAVPPAARPVAPPPPFVAPPLPSGRVRVAELSESMLIAAPVAFLLSSLCLPSFNILGIDLPPRPPQLALLFGMTLLGSWTVLMASKLWEAKPTSAVNRHFGMAAVGVALWVAATALAHWSGLGPLPGLVGPQPAGVEGFSAAFPSLARREIDAGVIGAAGYFALAFGAIPWRMLTARDRRAYFRLLPTAALGGLAALLGAAIAPTPQPWAALAVVLVAITAQFASKWSAEGAAARVARRRAA